MVTNEDKKIVAYYMGWTYHITDDGKWWNCIGPKGGNHLLDLNDAGLVVKEMVKRGEWDSFIESVEENTSPICETWNRLFAWLFDADNFFKAFAEWRELEAIKRAEGSIPPFNHKHCFDSDGKCSCGLLEEFYDEGEGK
jgi:hypothetical protein